MISVDRLFDMYRETGFLYPEKLERLERHLVTIKDNWERLLASRDGLMTVHTSSSSAGRGASVTSWRSTSRSALRQHLVALNSPLDARNVVLASLRDAAERGDVASSQWFRMANRLPGRIFGTSPAASHLDIEYLTLPRSLDLRPASGVRVLDAARGVQDGYRELLVSRRGSSFMCVEDLDEPELESVDRLFRKAGLRRFRRVAVATRSSARGPLGVALAYRGPLGTNFSFLENRIEIVLQTGLEGATREQTARALLSSIQPVYDDFPLMELVVTASDCDATALRAVGLRYERSYRHAIAMNADVDVVCKHIGGFFDGVERRQTGRAATA